MPQVRIAVVSPDRLYCEGLLRIIEAESALTCVGQDQGPGLLPALRGVRPDVVIVDSRLDGALRLCTKIQGPEGPAVIFVAAPDDDAWGTRALEAGARGILARPAGARDLLRAVQAVRAGQIWANRRAIAGCILAARTARRPPEPGRERNLSAREGEVFRCVAAGLSNKEVGHQLGISPATVKAHLARIFQKLGLRGRAELAAAYHGVVREPRPAPEARRPLRPTA